jgi:BirA family biotin operon repressor/biotin-[acetyl-CoA-carboxylase] ligase
LIEIADSQPIIGLSGWRALHVETTGSTNADLIELAGAGHDIDRLWLTAGEQMQGRGRRGRTWVSPHGNLHASLYLRSPVSAKDIGFFPLVCAVALHRAISEALDENQSEIKIKWPNDILVDGAKCCGMLMESDQRSGAINIVIGCGVNIVAHPEDTPYPAMHLNEKNATLTPQDMFQYLAESFARTLDEWADGSGKASIRDYWLAHVRGMGQTIIVNLASERLEGIFDGIDADGVLSLRLPSGKVKEISAGDVFFPR